MHLHVQKLIDLYADNTQKMDSTTRTRTHTHARVQQDLRVQNIFWRVSQIFGTHGKTIYAVVRLFGQAAQNSREPPS